MGFKFKIFFIFFIFGTVLLGLSLIGFNTLFLNGIKKQSNENVQRVIHIQEKRIYSFIKEYKEKLKVIGSNSYLHEYITNITNDTKEIDIFLSSVLETNTNIEKIRYIDNTGMEKLRFERKNKKVVKVDERYLQDKSNRYYFKEIMKINNIWCSRLDLNMERGKVELPIKPVIRIAKRIGNGFIIINININELIEKLHMSPVFDIFIVDKEGNFMVHKDKKFSWNKYLKKDYFIDNEFKEISNDILKKDFFSSGGIASKKLILNNEDGAILIIRMSQEISQKKMNEFYNLFITVSLIALLLSIIAAYIFARPIISLTKKLDNSKKLLSVKVKEKTRKLQKYLDIINQYIVISTTDLKGNIIFANEAFSKISGYNNDELIGKSQNIIRHKDMPKSIFKDLWDTIIMGKQWKGRIKNLKKNGEYYWVDTIIEPDFNDKGEMESYTAVGINITDKIELEELIKNQEFIIESQIKIANMQRDKAIKASDTKSEFLANMSHEIRTPLNAILGFVNILKENIKNEQNKEYLSTIDSSSHHLLGIINDILDFSKIENKLLQIDKVDFNTQKEFNSIINLFKAKCKEKNINFIVDIDENLPKFIHSDPLRIKQIISNLLSNAIKFTKNDNSVKIKIDFKNNLLNILVKDSGIGIAKENIEKIFKAFSQGDSTTTRKFGGTGLGLTISSELTRLLSGELNVKSEPGEGSEFYFSIPIELAKEIGFEKKEGKNKKLKGHVLLVEDNIANQMFMKVILKKIGLTFDIANDGLEAVEVFIKSNSQDQSNYKYNIILMDENMPNMNGIEATKKILEIEKEKKLIHTPIVALTANALKGDKERFLAAGMDEYLTKPLDKEMLMTVLSRSL